MINVNDLKPGITFLNKGDIFNVLEYSHSKQGRGQANVKVKVKDLRTGTIKNITFTGGDKVEKAHIESKKVNYIYEQDDNLIFMDQNTYEQIEVNKSKLKWELNFIKENLSLDITSYKNEILGIKLPNSISFIIIETTDATRGDTVSGATKEAKLETGFKIQVPLFIKNNESVVVDTRDGKYISRT